jgi:hypothetical protein
VTKIGRKRKALLACGGDVTVKSARLCLQQDILFNFNSEALHIINTIRVGIKQIPALQITNLLTGLPVVFLAKSLSNSTALS